MKDFLKSAEFKTFILYLFTSVIIYVGFWGGWYFLSFSMIIAISISLAIVAGLMIAIAKKSTWAPFGGTVLLSVAIGLAISSFFVYLKIEPSRFFGLILLIMLFYKLLQILILNFLPTRKLANSAFILFLVIEVVAAIIIACSSLPNDIKWQIFFALIVCIFYSSGQLIMRNSIESTFWRTAALCYVFGFVGIFIAAVLLAISLLGEDGNPFEAFGEFIGSAFYGVDVNAGGKKKIKNNIINKL